MAKYVKTALPVRQPEPTLHLCDRIIAKHTLDGAGSALNGIIDMTAFGLLVTNARSKRNSAELKEGEALGKFHVASSNAGLAAGQHKDHPDTIQWFARQIKDVLLVVHNGTEEEMNSYGFVVIISTTGARKNIKIELPNQLKEMIELGEAIIAHHTFLGAGSPLTAGLVDMAAFGTLVGNTRTLYDAWEVLRGEIQALNNDALTTLGYAPGQTITSPGTIYKELNKIRMRLLQKHQGKEEELSNWGFTVLISEKQTGKKKGNSISIKGKATDKSSGNPLANALVYVEELDLFTLTDADGNYEFEKLAAGTYTMQAHKTGYENLEVEGIVVVAGAATTVNFALEGEAGTGTINGTVRKTGVPVAANITVAGMATGTASAAGTGLYTLNDVPEGTQIVRATLLSDPSVFIEQPAIVTAGGVVTLDFSFP